MKHIEDMRNRLREQRNPGHEIGTFLLSHSNSTDYLVSQLEGWLEAAKADQAAERAFAGGLFRAVKKEKAEEGFETFLGRIGSGHYDGWQGFNQFRHDVPAHYGKGGDVLDGLLEKHGDLSERGRLEEALGEFVKLI